MNDILDLPGWTVLAKRLDGTEYELEAEYAVQPTVCPKCGSLGKPYKHGTKNTTYRDSPIRGKTTRILARVQRYRCRDCGETFLQPLAGVLANRLMTERCAEFIGEQCLVDTFVRIAEDVGCDDKTVRTWRGVHRQPGDPTSRSCRPGWASTRRTIEGDALVLTDVGNKRSSTC
jgi:transposase